MNQYYESTYVALRVLPESSGLIKLHCAQYGIKMINSEHENSLHVTLMTSHNPSKNFILSDAVYECYFSGYDTFQSSDGLPVLVAVLSCPQIIKRHEFLKEEYKLKHVHDEFIPHITLCYKCKERSISELPPIEFPIYLGNEYITTAKF